MSALEEAVRREIEEVHRFFVEWFNGTARRSDFDSRFADRLDPEMVFVSPDGNRPDRTALLAGIRQAHGANPGFRIAIRDVKLLRDLGEALLVSYTEWQRGARSSARGENARFTTLVITKPPFRWLHVHETWLPEAGRAAGSFDF
ncbi:MAG: hypothetical protein AAF495_01965 [Pseudomonadota bacterium]